MAGRACAPRCSPRCVRAPARQARTRADLLASPSFVPPRSRTRPGQRLHRGHPRDPQPRPQGAFPLAVPVSGRGRAGPARTGSARGARREEKALGAISSLIGRAAPNGRGLSGAAPCDWLSGGGEGRCSTWPRLLSVPPVAVIARARRGGGACGDGGGRGGNARGPGAARLVLDGRRRRGDKYGPDRGEPGWLRAGGGSIRADRGGGGLRGGLDRGESRGGSEGLWRDRGPAGGLRAGSGSGGRGGRSGGAGACGGARPRRAGPGERRRPGVIREWPGRAGLGAAVGQSRRWSGGCAACPVIS